jgi:hypothetical protein
VVALTAPKSAEAKECNRMSQDYNTPPPTGQMTGQTTGQTTREWKSRLNDAAREIEYRGREVINEGNARRLIVQQNGRDIVNMPLTVAGFIAAVAVLFAPPLAVLAVIAALLARVRAHIE